MLGFGVHLLCERCRADLPFFPPERNDQFGQCLIGNTAVQLSVQRTQRSLTQGIARRQLPDVDVRIEQGPRDLFSMALELLVGAKPSSRRSPTCFSSQAVRS